MITSLIITFTIIITRRTRLTLSSFDRRDEGTYYCVSKNEMGITRGNIQVFSELRFDKMNIKIVSGSCSFRSNPLVSLLIHDNCSLECCSPTTYSHDGLIDD